VSARNVRGRVVLLVTATLEVDSEEEEALMFVDRLRGRSGVSGVIAVCVLLVSLVVGVSAGQAASRPSATVEIIAPLTGVGGAYQPWVDAAQAAVRAENAHPSGNRAQINLKICDAGESSNTEEACAREAVADKVAGTVDMSNTESGIEPILKQGHIADVSFMADPITYTSPVAYSTTALGMVAFLGLDSVAKSVGCHKYMILDADPGSPAVVQALINNFEAQVKRFHMQTGGIEIQPGTPDMSPYIQRALSDGADCVFPNGFGADEVAMLQAGAQGSKTLKLLTVPGLLTQQTITSLGPIMNRVIGDDFAWPISSAAQHPGLRTFESQLNKYAPSPHDTSDASIASWADARALISAIWQVQGAITSKKVIQQLNTFTNYSTGIGPALTFSKPNPVKGYPRVFTPYVIRVKWVNGVEESVGKFYNFFTGKTVAAS
jgi:ABC-type branched-subunit amino acid transport system substrate-binding protein